MVSIRSASAGRAVLPGVSGVVAAGFAVPFAYLLARNAGAPAELWHQLTRAANVRPLVNSLVLALAVALTDAVVGTAVAWLAVRTDVPGARVWRSVLPLPLVLPSFIGALALVAAFAPGGLVASATGLRVPRFEGFWAAYTVLTLLTYPYVFLPAAARFEELPRSLEEAARLFGRSPRRVFASVVLPQVSPAVVAGALVAFLYVLGDFGAVQILRYDTLTRAIYARRLLDRQASLALGLELGALALMVVVAERAATARLRRMQAPARSAPLVVGLRRWRRPAAAGLAGLSALALAAPLGVLAFWAVRGAVRGSVRMTSLLSDTGSLAGPALNTAAVGVTAAAVTVAAVLPVAYLTTRRRGAEAATANAVVVAGFALPGVALALALAFFTLRAPWPVGLLYQTHALLIAGYTIHFGAPALRSAQVAVGGVPVRMDEAARALGAGRARRLVTVDLPLMAPGLAAAGGIVLLSVMKELPATLLLAPAGFRTLATTIWGATEDAFLADASLAALALVLLSGVLTWVLVIRRRRSDPEAL